MCLILFSYDKHPRYKLIFAANRDEFYDRPTRPAKFWNASPDLLAGKDLKGGGTWMGITRSGRIAAITNFREPEYTIENAPSRGFLVRDFLESDLSSKDYLNKISKIGGLYNGFNLIVGTPDGLFYYSNRQNKILKISPGIHGISNHLINTNWPKVKKGTQLLADIISKDNCPDTEALFSMLQDQTQPPDCLLPNTGVSLEWERLLSPLFITGSIYGTRSSTILLWDRDGNIKFSERTFTPDHGRIVNSETREFRFQRVFM
jgi:uncharacterized protein with NRDE domain